MADGGAWQSGVFDNGREFQHRVRDKKSAPAAEELPTVPGVPALMYNPPASIGGGKDGGYMPIISIALRCACIMFTVVDFAVIASNEGSQSTYSDYGEHYWLWKAVNLSSLAYLLAIDVIVCAYSIVQLILSIVNSCTGKPVLSGPTTPASTISFVCDQALTYMLIAGCGAGACVSAAAKKGEAYSCSLAFSIACDKNAAAVAMSFIAFFCIALSCAMSYFRVYKMAKI